MNTYKCWGCGKEIKINGHPGYYRIYCPECAKKKEEQAKKDFDQYWYLKNKMTMERAIKRIEEDIYDFAVPMEHYREAIDTVWEYVQENPHKLESTEEYIALIVFLDARTHITCQKQILNYRVDFSLDDLKLIVEIDGSTHKNKKYHDTKRDIEILKELGPDWDIMRIPTDIVNKHPRALYDGVVDYKIKRKEFKKINGNNAVRLVKAKEHDKALRANDRQAAKDLNREYACGNLYSKVNVGN